MRRILVTALCIAGTAAFMSFAAAEGAATETKAAAGDGVWLGLFSEGAPLSTADTKALEQKLGRRFASLMWFTDFSNPFPAEAAENAWAAGSIPNVTWEPWFWAENERIHLADINAGSWDAYISEWGAAAAKFGKTIFVRWGHEFNGDWYPWGIAKNGQDPQKYISAFRRVHDLVVRAGAKNVVWVWCPNASSVPSQDWNDPLASYPGDAYVDWIAIDGYDFESNASFEDIFSKTYDELVRKIDKPIYIGEFATGRVGAEKAAWLKDMHASLNSQFRGVKGIVYFNVKKERDWRLDDSAESLAGAKEIFSLPFYKSESESVAALAGAFHKNYASYKNGLAPASNADRKSVGAKRLARDSSGKVDWSGVSAAEVSGKNGLAGSVKFGWDAERLYIRAELKDKYPLSNGQKNDVIWNGDCIEVCISTDPNADPSRTKFTSTDWQLGFAPQDQAKSLPARSWEWSKLRSAVPGAEVVSAPMEGGYTLDISFPWASLKGFTVKEGMVLGFDFAVDDSGASGTRSFQWIWNGSNQFYNSPVQWGIIKLIP